MLYKSLKNIVPEESILISDSPASSALSQYQVDGIAPQLVAFPQNVQQVSQILRLASELKAKVIPCGNRSKVSFGNPPKEIDLILSLCKLNRIIEYEPADLTITVEAGAKFSDFQNALSKEGQFLALDPPYHSKATLGGIVASNSNGPLRLRYGTLRDMVIGVKVVLADGSIAKSGGKVVKNVSGYDLNKLFIGSFGTLGVIVELSFKLQPLPHHKKSVFISFETLHDAIAFAFEVLNSSLIPSFLELISIDQASTGKSQKSQLALIVGVDGHSETSEWQVNQLQKLAERAKVSEIRILSGDEDQKTRESLRSFTEWHPDSSDVICICKASLLLSEIESIFEEARSAAESIPLKCDILSHIGNGIVLIRFSDHSHSLSQLSSAVSAISKLREKCFQKGGNLIIEAAPPQLKSKIDVWGKLKSDFRLMKGVKSELDPNSILNPGRFLGGI